MNQNKKYIEIGRKIVSDVDSEVLHFQHIKYKSQIILLKNNDSHLALNIGFNTPAFDNTGIPHILEHCIYSGSKDYPSLNVLSKIKRETFCTHINAITGIDKTNYQYSTLSKNDLWNVMKIYFDILFNPLVLEDTSIFKLQANSMDKYGHNIGGVVYREMLDIYKSDKQILFREINKRLFSQSKYQYSTAGIPSEIIKANYYDLQRYHQEFYNLSNCYIYVYGCINEIELLNKIDSMLEKYYVPPKNIIGFKFNNKHSEKNKYNNISNVTADSQIYHNTIKKEQFSINWIVGGVENPEDYYIYEVLRRALLIYNNNELVRRIKSININYELSSYFNNGLYKYPFGLIVSADKIEDACQIKDVVITYFKEIVLKKFYKFFLKEIIDYLEYASTTGVYRGIKYNQKYGNRVFESIIYGAKPEIFLETHQIYERIRSSVENDNFIDIISKILNSDPCIVVLKKEKERTNNVVSSYFNSNQKVNIITNNNKSLINTKSISEILNVMDKENLFRLNRYTINGVNVFNLKNTNPNHIIKINIFFRKKFLNIIDIQYLKLVLKQFGMYGTNNKSSIELNYLIQKYLYDYRCGIEGYSDNNDEICIYFSFSTFKYNLNNALEVLLDILYNSKVKEYFKYNGLIKNEYLKMYRAINNKSYYFAKLHSKSKFSALDFKNDNFNGMNYFLFLTKLLSDKESEVGGLKLANILKEKVFCKCNASLIVSTKNEIDDSISKGLNKFISNLNDYEIVNDNQNTNILGKEIHIREAFLVQNKLSSLSQSIKLINFKDKFALEASEMLIKQYCDNILKLKGVYSSYTEVDNNGLITVTSFRNPEAENSLDIIEGLITYLRNINLTEQLKTEITQYILMKKYNDFLTLNEISLLRNCLDNSVNLVNSISKFYLDKDYLNIISDNILDCIEKQSICYIGNRLSLNNSQIYENITEIKEL